MVRMSLLGPRAISTGTMRQIRPSVRLTKALTFCLPVTYTRQSTRAHDRSSDPLAIRTRLHAPARSRSGFRSAPGNPISAGTSSPLSTTITGRPRLACACLALYTATCKGSTDCISGMGSGDLVKVNCVPDISALARRNLSGLVVAKRIPWSVTVMRLSSRQGG